MFVLVLGRFCAVAPAAVCRMRGAGGAGGSRRDGAIPDIQRVASEKARVGPNSQAGKRLDNGGGTPVRRWLGELHDVRFPRADRIVFG